VIHSISTGAGAELIDRALQSIFTCYAAQWRSHKISSLQAWELENLIFDTNHQILTGCEATILKSFFDSYGKSIETPIYWWQILPPSARQWESIVPSVLALKTSSHNLQSTFLLSQEYGEVWKTLITKVNPQTIELMNASASIVMLPDLDLQKLQYTPAPEPSQASYHSQQCRVAISLVMSRVDRQTTNRVGQLLSTVLDRVPIYTI
jgi:hypothetical protein